MLEYYAKLALSPIFWTALYTYRVPLIESQKNQFTSKMRWNWMATLSELFQTSWRRNLLLKLHHPLKSWTGLLRENGIRATSRPPRPYNNNLFPQEIIKVREWIPYRPYTQGNPSKVIFRYGTQFLTSADVIPALRWCFRGVFAGLCSISLKRRSNELRLSLCFNFEILIRV